MYENGYGVTKNLTEAKKWYGKAAAQGDDDAKERLKVLNGNNYVARFFSIFSTISSYVISIKR